MASDKITALYNFLKEKLTGMGKRDIDDEMAAYGSILDKLEALIEKYAMDKVCDHIMTWIKLYAGSAIKTALINFVKTAIWGTLIG